MAASRYPLLLLTLLAPRAVPAQEKPLAPLVLRLPGGTRAGGLGNAFVAGRGAEVLFSNPAQIGILRGSTISGTRFGSRATLGTFSTVGTLGRLSLGAGVQYLDYHPPAAAGLYIRPAQLSLGGTLNAASLAATLAVMTRIMGVRLGAGAKYVQESIGGLRDGGLALDLGAAREVGRATLGLSVQNIGGGLDILGQEAELPTRVSLGAMSPSIFLGTYFDLVVSVAVARERHGRIVPAGGAELFYQPVEGWVFVARAGARRVEEGPLPKESPLALGGSVGLDRIWLDYAFQPSRGSRGAHRLGIRIQ